MNMKHTPAAVWWLVPGIGLCALAAGVFLWPGQKSRAAQHAGATQSGAVAPAKGVRVRHVDFASQVLPVLSEKCFACHGPDEHTRYGGYRLDLETEAKSDKYKAIVPNHPELSNAWLRITTDNPKQVMPPLASHKILTSEQKQTIRDWIAQGAKYDQHWAYKPLVRPALPKVSDEAWCKTPLDRFVMAKLDEKGMKPSPQADKATLLRRVSLDLTGLPPTLAELNAFLSDASPDAYEKQVDRLLAAPAFGERMATPWLDLARYGDTQGYEKDNDRTIWAYRDWVIAAYNADLPFDQFVIRQLAGDLLGDSQHPPTQDDLIATAFQRNTLTNTEGGTDDEEYRMAAIHDRTSTAMQGIMGLSFMCAQCHTHKYDPILHEDYYRLFAFFNQSADSDKDDERPTLDVTAKTGQKTSVPVMRELPAAQARKTYLLTKGSFLAPDKERGVMLPDTPKFLPPMAKGLPHNRLGLAKWLTARENPLTARVQANRLWAQFFGHGIVTSLEDMGLQSAQPSHPELLDFMADAWMTDMGWSVKKLCREITLSAVYRQSSVITEEELAADAQNKWLARGPRLRLSAEQLRDQALAVAGLLNPEMYGPPAMPWMPPEVIQPKSFGGVGWHVQLGEAGRRRAVYVKVERGQPYPSLGTFDTPLRDRCTVSRPPTNTPLQALVSLNDPVFNECHQGLARLALAEKGPAEAQLAFAFRRALLRAPKAEELDTLKNYRADRLAWYAVHADDAKARATDPLGALPEGMQAQDAAAMTDACALLMNLDEFLTKG